MMVVKIKKQKAINYIEINKIDIDSMKENHK